MQVSALASAVALLLGAGAALAPGAAVGEVESPLTGELTASRTQARPGQTVALTLRLSSRVAFQAVEVQLTVPDGTTLTAGRRRVELRDLKPEKARVLRWRVRVDGAGERRIQVDARVLGIAPSVVRESFLAVVNARPHPVEHPPTFRVDEHGQGYRVYDIPARN